MKHRTKYQFIAILVVLAGGVISPAGLAAQGTVSLTPDFGIVRKSDPRLTGYNAAGLHAIPVGKISVAEVSFDRNMGKFVNYNQSDDSYGLGARTESFYRINPRTVMYGKVEYGYFKGRNMGASVFTDPCYNPFDLVEWSDDARGSKKYESYHLAGAVSSEVAPGLRIGGKIDYLDANYTKLKDLRHKNTFMDMTVTAGLSYRLGRLLEVGANYLYRRSTESLNAGVYSNNNVTDYYILVDYGAFFGKLEGAFANYISDIHSQLMFNDFHGGSLQLTFDLSPSVRFFNEITFKSRGGYYGRKSPSTVVHTNHDSYIAEYRGDLRFGRNELLHTIRADAAFEDLSNYENIRKEEGSDGESTDIIYYGQLETLSRSAFSAGVEYECIIGMENYNPVWTLAMSANYWSRELKASYYPYFRKQDMNYLGIQASAGRNIFRKRNMYSVWLSLMYGSGGGTENDDGLYAPPSESQREPDVIDRYRNREFEYLTSDRAGGRLGFRFTTPVAKSVMGYVSVEGIFTRGLNLEYIPKSTFYSVAVKVGCLF